MSAYEAWLILVRPVAIYMTVLVDLGNDLTDVLANRPDGSSGPSSTGPTGAIDAALNPKCIAIAALYK